MSHSILVTGGLGYIGSHIVKHLSELGENVVVFDQSTDRSTLFNKEKLYVGDIRSPRDLTHVFESENITTVIHCAALVNAFESIAKSELYHAVNAKGTRVVAQTAASHNVPYFLYASSAAVYGIPINKNPLSENVPIRPTNPYGQSKFDGEVAVRDVYKNHHLIFRFFNVAGSENDGRLGPHHTSGAFFQRVFSAAYSDQLLTINGNDYDTSDGTAVRDFVHVEDIARAFGQGIAYLRSGSPSATLNLGSGEPHTLNDLVRTAEKVTGKKIHIQYGPRAEGDIGYSLADVSAAQRVLQWHAQLSLTDIATSGWKHYLTQLSLRARV